MKLIVKKISTLLFGKRSTTGFVIEKFSNGNLSGWIALEDKSNPEDSHFYLFEAGKKIELSVTLFNRKDFNKDNSNNLYGFRIKFAKTLNNLASKSFFYIDKSICLEPDYLLSADLLLAEPENPLYYSNRISMFEILEKKLGTNIVRVSESELEQNQQDQIQLITSLETADLSDFKIHVGLRSKCAIAVVGKGGHLYLHGGSNNVDGLFQKDNLGIDKYEEWKELFGTRKQMAKTSDFRYVQMVIPEKQSMLPNLYYREIDIPSPQLKMIEQLKYDNYFSVLESMREHSNIELFFKTDSHLNGQGSFLLFAGLLEYLGLSADMVPKFDRNNKTIGDLGSKFAPFKFWEFAPVASGIKVQQRENVYQYIPQDKGHMGRHIHWKNPKAPINKKVLIFGNSFFDMGTHQHHLTYWFSLAFIECQFVWSTEFNQQLISTYKPDIVIGQTIERFLRLVPTS